MRQFLKQASTDPNAKVQSLGAERLDGQENVLAPELRDLLNKNVVIMRFRERR